MTQLAVQGLILIACALIACVILIDRHHKHKAVDITHHFGKRRFATHRWATPPDKLEGQIGDYRPPIVATAEKPAFDAQLPLLNEPGRVSLTTMSTEEQVAAIDAMFGDAADKDIVASAVASIMLSALSCECEVTQVEEERGVKRVTQILSNAVIAVDSAVDLDLKSHCTFAYTTDFMSELKSSCPSSDAAAFSESQTVPKKIPADGAETKWRNNANAATDVKFELQQLPNAYTCTLTETFEELDCIVLEQNSRDNRYIVELTGRRSLNPRRCVHEITLNGYSELMVECYPVDSLGWVRVEADGLGSDATSDRSRWSHYVVNQGESDQRVRISLMQERQHTCCTLTRRML